MINAVCRYIGIFAVAFIATPVIAQVMMPSAQSNRTEMLIGEQATVSVALELETSDKWPDITFPYLQDSLPGGLEIVEFFPVDTVQPNESNRELFQLSQKYIVTTFDSGLYHIASFPVIVNRDTLWTNTLKLMVNTMAVDTTQTAINDIKDIYDIDLTWQDYVALYWWIGALVIGLLILLLVGYYFWKKRREKPAVELVKPEPKIPAHVIALGALEQMVSEKAWMQSRLKKFHTDLTDVLRDYIEDRFDVHAQEQTTGEILQNLRFISMGEDATRQLQQVLRLADMVKFAKERPSEAENERSLQMAIQFVKATKPAPQASTPPESTKPSPDATV